MSVGFRIFKENSLNRDERNVSTLDDAIAIYDRYFADGYSVRIVEVETGAEYAMWSGKLVRVPYSQHPATNMELSHGSVESPPDQHESF